MNQPSSGTWRKLVVWALVLLPPAILVSSIAWMAVAQPGCVSCNTRDRTFAAATRGAPHSGVECVDCHVAPAPIDRIEFASRQLFHMVVPLVDGQGREWESVADARCVGCHKQINERVVRANGYRIDHASCAARSQCTDCHADTGHGSLTTWVRSYDMETCLECHVSEGATACDTCHDEKQRAARVATGVFAITHGKEWRKTHGMGNMANCSVCHTAAKCDKCHGVGLPHDKEFREKHGAFASLRAARCGSCHEDTFCSGCHGLPMPHTRTFTERHAATAKKSPKLCKRCHADPDCVGCHLKHVHPGGAVDPRTDPVGGGGE